MDLQKSFDFFMCTACGFNMVLATGTSITMHRLTHNSH